MKQVKFMQALALPFGAAILSKRTEPKIGTHSLKIKRL